jgi:hypothetical protein
VPAAVADSPPIGWPDRERTRFPAASPTTSTGTCLRHGAASSRYQPGDRGGGFPNLGDFTHLVRVYRLGGKPYANTGDPG